MAACGDAEVKPCRLHVVGASGSGTTTVGRALATEWSVPHADTDDYFWLPTPPPYAKRSVAESLRLMGEIFLGRAAWVLSGSVTEGGDPLIPYFDAVVFLTVDSSVRLERLRSREATRLGADVHAGEERESALEAFMEWAARYEDPQFDGRNRARHERWLSRLRCPVLRLDSAQPVHVLVAAVTAWTGTAQESTPG